MGLAVVKKIADEHGARVRIANLSMARASSGITEGPPRGAQVSLSFSKFAPADGSAEMTAGNPTSSRRNNSSLTLLGTPSMLTVPV